MRQHQTLSIFGREAVFEKGNKTSLADKHSLNNKKYKSRIRNFNILKVSKRFTKFDVIRQRKWNGWENE